MTIASFLIILFSALLVDGSLEFGSFESIFPAFASLILLGIGLVVLGFLVFRHCETYFEQFRTEYLRDGTLAELVTEQKNENRFIPRTL